MSEHILVNARIAMKQKVLAGVLLWPLAITVLAASETVSDQLQQQLLNPVQASPAQDSDYSAFTWPDGELSGTFEQEWAWSPKQKKNPAESQKFESLLDLQWQQDAGEESRFTLLTRLRYDTENRLSRQDLDDDNYSGINGPFIHHSHGDISIRELYLDTETDGVIWRLGKQQVVWGESDGLKVLDQVNPQSFREFILDEFDDSRIPLWMVNAEIDVGEEGQLQLLWIPDTTYHQMPQIDSAYAFSQPSRVPSVPAGIPVTVPVTIAQADSPNHGLKDSELGLKYTAFIDGWDLSLNYLYHYNDFAVLYQDQDKGQDVASNGVTITPEYQRSHLVGGSLSNAFGDMTLRAELGLNSDSYFISRDLSAESRGIANSAELSSVIGLDYQGLSDIMLSIQWFQSSLLDYQSAIIRDRTEHTLSFLYEQNFANETWKFKTLLLHSLNDEDGLLRPKLSWNVESELDVWLGADVIYGSQNGLYGQFSEQDRLHMGVEYGF